MKHGPFPLDRKRPGRVRVKPITKAEWQEAVDAAYFALVLDAAYQYGLATGPPVRVNRCQRVLREGKKQGIVPSPGVLDHL